MQIGGFHPVYTKNLHYQKVTRNICFRFKHFDFYFVYKDTGFQSPTYHQSQNINFQLGQHSTFMSLDIECNGKVQKISLSMYFPRRLHSLLGTSLMKRSKL